MIKKTNRIYFQAVFAHYSILNICINQNSLLTLPSDALAPTLSPLEFQHTSNIPPVPL